MSATPRCPAAHHDDPTPCDGPPVVTVLDAHHTGADGCEHHATRLLASLEGGRVHGLPDAPVGAAIRVFKAADGIRPFAWVDGPRTRLEELSRTEQRDTKGCTHRADEPCFGRRPYGTPALAGDERYVIGRNGVFATLYDRQEQRLVVDNSTEEHCRAVREELSHAENRRMRGWSG